MATATQRKYTPDDLLKMSIKPTPELVNGRLVRRSPMGQQADSVAMKLGGRLLVYSETTLPGVVNGSEGGYQIFSDDPERVRFPDVSFTRIDRLPNGKPVMGHSRVIPDLVAEIISPNDRAGSLRLKIRDYLSAGIPLILVVNPESRDVEAMRADGTGILLKEGQSIDGGDALPGFSCPVSALFDGI